MTSRLNGILSGTCAVLLGVTLLLTSAEPALAGHNGQQNGGFREFRLQNAGLDRHAARRMFVADRRSDRARLSIQPINSLRVQNLTSVREARIERRLERIDILNGRQQSLQVNQNGALVKLNSGINLDFTSGDQNIVLGKNLFSDSVSSVQINVGGETKTLTAGSHVTAAEYVAAKQILTGQSQSVVINGAGAATGGNIDLGALTQDNDVMRASNLVVSSNVTTSGDFGKHSDFRLQGDLINYGTVNAFSSDSSVRRGTLHAQDIDNHVGGLINSTVDLTLDAAGNLNNEGTISSSQSLTLLAGASINNSGSISGAKDVNLQSSVISNHGLVQSTSGNLNLDGPATAALSVNNRNGTMSALNGAINLRNTAYSGTSATAVTGGDLISRELNINSGQGLATVDVNQLTGLVTGTGSSAHVSASTDVLTIGSVCLTGDPTFFNQGDIEIQSDLTVGENLVIVAAGNITSLNDVTIQAGNATQGFDITLIAGAAFSSNGGDNSPTLPNPANDGGVTLSGKSSKTGGGIQLGSNTFVLAQSTDLSGNDQGGDILLAAFGGKGAIAGKVLVDPSSFKTGGSGTGSNGDIRIIAGSKEAGTVVELGVLDTTGGSGAAGTVSVTTSAPVAAFRNQPIIYDASGNLTNGALIPSKVDKKADIHIGNDSSGVEVKSSGAVALNGGTISMDGQIEALTSTILFRSTGAITGNTFSGIKATSVDLEAAGDIGTSVTKLNVETPLVTVNKESSSKGANIFLSPVGTAGSQTTVDVTFAQGQLVVDSPTLRILVNATNMTSYDLNTFRFAGSILSTKPAGLFKLTTTDPTFNLNNITLIGTKTVNFDVAGNFGVSGSPNAFDKTSNVSVTAGKGIFLFVGGKKTEITVAAGDDVVLGTTGGIVKSATSTTGQVAIASLGSTLSINGNISAAGGVDIQNTGAKSADKIAFNANSQVTGDTININVGPSNPIEFPGEPPFVLLVENSGGSVTLTGSGIKAKAPNSTITSTGPGHAITINNGYKIGNITFGGGVLMTAN